MAWIPPGEFEMGSRDPKDEGRHRVRLTKGYWMAQIEVTQREYNKVTGANPSRFAGSPYLPVDWVAWDQAAAYCRKLTDLEREAGRLPAGYEYRLPTEAEWEYACRAALTRISACRKNGPGHGTAVAAGRTKWPSPSQTPGACMTCMGMPWSGVSTPGPSIRRARTR